MISLNIILILIILKISAPSISVKPDRPTAQSAAMFRNVVTHLVN